MKNKILLFIITFIAFTHVSVNKLSAQDGLYDLTVPPIYLDIDANQDREVRKTFEFTIDFYNGGRSLIQEVDLYVRLNEDIANGIGAVIDPSKIKIELREVLEGPRKNQLNKYPTILLSKQSQKIVEGRWSGFGRPALSAGGDRWTFSLDLVIDKKDLKELENGIYPLNLDFKFDVEVYWFIVDNRRYSSTANSYGQINVINYAPSFGLEVNANATLDFTSPEHYTRQVENDLSNSWVKVTSKNSGYVIKVKTNTPNFELIRNDSGVSGDTTIPVNVVNVEMQSAGSGASQGAKPLSSTVDAQTLFIGTKNKNTQKLPVRYFIRKTEAEKLATKTSGEYKAILTYTLEPN